LVNYDAFFHEHTAFLNDLRKAVSEMENGIGKAD